MERLAFRTFDAARDMAAVAPFFLQADERVLFDVPTPLTSTDEFTAWFSGKLRTSFHDFFVLEQAGSGAFAGFAFSYDYRSFDLHCKVGIVTVPEVRGTGLPALAACDLLARLFRAYPLRKVYALVYDFNRQSLASNLAAGFVEEGLLREDRYWDGAWHDCHVLGLTREAFAAGCGKFAEGTQL